MAAPVRLADRYEAVAARWRRIADAYAGAVLRGDVAFEVVANAAVRVWRDAASLRRYRDGEPVVAWPKVAPWAGF